jgi:CDP-glucose 4,6-dehydratase
MEKVGLNLVLQKINPDFWRNKRVLLTGHTGFKGGWLSLWLQSMGATSPKAWNTTSQTSGTLLL